MRRPIGYLVLLISLAGGIGWLKWNTIGAQPGSFLPPTLQQAVAAIGDTSGLSKEQIASFDPKGFDVLGKPGPSDWLANHREAGQTFPQYMRGQPNVPNQKRNKIYLQPLGEFDATKPGQSIDQIKDFANRYFQMEVIVLPPTEVDEKAIKSRTGGEGQTQLLSTDVLQWCKGQLPDDAYCILAITMVDLYPQESWNYVFGQASLRERVGVYSFSRYKAADPALVLRRCCRVMGHETGHMFGIKHCVHFKCLMNGSNHLEEADSQPLHLCPVCLRKLQAAIGFDITKRYEQLRDFSKAADLNNESTWLANRLKTIQGN